MGSVFIPVDRCTRENSCLQVLDGSHKMGRINHILEGEQAGADPERYEIALFLKRFPEKQIKFFFKEKNRYELAF